MANAQSLKNLNKYVKKTDINRNELYGDINKIISQLREKLEPFKKAFE